MGPVLYLCIAAIFPFVLLALLLWLSRLEDTLPSNAHRLRPEPGPAPVSSTPVLDRPLPPGLLHHAMLVDAVLAADLPAGHPVAALHAQPAAQPAAVATPAELDVPTQRRRDDQITATG